MRRILTEEEVMQLAETYRARGRWYQVRDFADALYGPQAAKVVVEVSSFLLYNDESYYRESGMREVTVYDKQGKALMPDLALPFWQQERQKARLEEARRQRQVLLHLQEQGWPVRQGGEGWNEFVEAWFCERKEPIAYVVEQMLRGELIKLPLLHSVHQLIATPLTPEHHVCSYFDEYDFDAPPTVLPLTAYVEERGENSEVVRRVLEWEDVLRVAAEYEARKRWEQMRTMIRGLYGESAFAIQLNLTVTKGESQGYFQSNVTEVSVRDAENRELSLDESLPLWQEQFRRRFTTGLREFGYEEEEIGEPPEYLDDVSLDEYVPPEPEEDWHEAAEYAGIYVHDLNQFEQAWLERYESIRILVAKDVVMEALGELCLYRDMAEVDVIEPYSIMRLYYQLNSAPTISLASIYIDG